MGRLTIRSRNDALVMLCDKCQLEVNEDDQKCENCGATLIEQSVEEMSLLPTDVEVRQSEYVPKEAINQTVSSEKTSAEATQKQRFSFKQHLNKLPWLIGFVLIALIGVFYRSTINLIATPIIENAEIESQVIQDALLDFKKHKGVWPQTTEILSQYVHISPSDKFYYVMISNGDFQQVFKSPFFLEGSVITWQRVKNNWTCHSQDLKNKNIKLTCVKS